MINIQQNIPLSKYTTFRIGGPAKHFVEVATIDELKEALDFAKKNNLDFFVLGGGSNILVSDAGFSGLVIKIKLNDIKLEGKKMEIGTGVFLAKAVRDSIENNFSGMEWATGIPGTLGGAVRGNAGAYGGEIKDMVESVKVLDTEKMEIKIFQNAECDFRYRHSMFKHSPKLVIVSAVLKLKKGNKENVQKKAQEIIAQRIKKLPQGAPSAGSFFINPVVTNEKLIKEFEEEKGVKSKAGKVPAGWLIEKADLKGKNIGGAVVNEIQTNYILNTGNATAEDVVMLASFIKQQVRDKFGVELMEEVQFIGF
ncbi:MAG TPA: UDP-N-acetylmuramate dehydrogenase [Patescibacteria group bacterium]